MADVLLAGVGLRSQFLSGGIEAAIDWKPFSDENKIETIFYGKSATAIGIDAFMGTFVGFGNMRMNQDGATKLSIGIVNEISSFSTGLAGEKIKNAIE